MRLIAHVSAGTRSRSSVTEGIWVPERIPAVADAVLERGTTEEFIVRANSSAQCLAVSGVGHDRRRGLRTFKQEAANQSHPAIRSPPVHRHSPATIEQATAGAEQTDPPSPSRLEEHRTVPGQRKRRTRPRHDASYKSFFAQRRTVADTLRGVARDVASGLDFSTLERLPASFVTEHLGQRHADMLWRIQTAAGGWLYSTTESGAGTRRRTSANCSRQCRRGWLDTCRGIGIFSSSCRRSIPRCCRPRTCCR